MRALTFWYGYCTIVTIICKINVFYLFHNKSLCPGGDRVDDIKYSALLKTAELGNITQAAEALGYTQPAVSRMVAELEKEWGVTLLVRSRSGVRLTSDGAYLLPHIREVCNAQKNLEGYIAHLHGLTSGTINVGTFMATALQWLPGIIRTFQQQYPNIEVQIKSCLEYSEVESWVALGIVDCGFLTLPLAQGHTPPLYTQFLHRDPLVALLPEDHPLAGAAAYPISRFAQDDFIQLREERDRDTAALFEAAGLHVVPRYITENGNIAMSMVESGLGVGISNEMMLGKVAYRIAAKPLDPPQFRDIAIASRPLESASPATRRFVAHVEEWVAGQYPSHGPT